MRPKSSTPRTDFGVRLIMARSCPALNPRRGGNQFLAEFVILTLEVADLLAQHGALVTRFQILSIERLGQRAQGIRQRSIMDSKYVASPHHFLLSAGKRFSVRSAAWRYESWHVEFSQVDSACWLQR